MCYEFLMLIWNKNKIKTQNLLGMHGKKQGEKTKEKLEAKVKMEKEEQKEQDKIERKKK